MRGHIVAIARERRIRECAFEDELVVVRHSKHRQVREPEPVAPDQQHAVDRRRIRGRRAHTTDDEVTVHVVGEEVAQVAGRGGERVDRARAERERVLGGLHARLERVHDARHAAHLHVRTEDGINGVRARKDRETLRARREGRLVAHGEQAGIEHVAAQERSRGGVVEHHVARLVAGGGQHHERASAQVERSRVLGPPRDAEGGADRVHVGRDHGGVRACGEAGVLRPVVAMPMRVRDDERHDGAARTSGVRAEQRVHEFANGQRRARRGFSTGVEEQRTRLPRHEVHERRLEVAVLRLADDPEARRECAHRERGLVGEPRVPSGERRLGARSWRREQRRGDGEGERARAPSREWRDGPTCPA